MFESRYIADSVEDIKKHTDKNKEYMIIAAEGFDFEGLQESIDAKWMGAIFPAIFAGKALYENKAFVCELSCLASMQWIGEKDIDTDYCPKDGCETYMAIVDGLSPNVTETLEYVYDNTPENTVMFGGGAGCLGERTHAYMYNGKDYTQRGMILLSTRRSFSLGVQHGYHSLENYSMVTKSYKNKIISIDGKDAFYFYVQEVKKHFGKEVNEKNLFQIGLEHPLMFEYTFGEKIVRVPMATDGTSLFMVGEVSADTIITLGTVLQKDLLIATQKATRNALEGLTSKPELGMVFTCVGREKFSYENFQKELDTIADELSGLDFVGALSLGEIANNSTGNLEFYNCTCVVGVK